MRSISGIPVLTSGRKPLGLPGGGGEEWLQFERRGSPRIFLCENASGCPDRRCLPPPQPSRGGGAGRCPTSPPPPPVGGWSVGSMPERGTHTMSPVLASRALCCSEPHRRMRRNGPKGNPYHWADKKVIPCNTKLIKYHKLNFEFPFRS